MKKIFTLALAFAAMASCSKNDIMETPQIEGNPEVISFNAFTGKQTRATDMTAFADGNNFAVWAKDSHTTPYQINGKEYKKVSGAWGWIVDQKWNEVKTYPITFNAVYPTQAGESMTGFNFTVANTSTTQVDLLHATSTANARPASGAVSFPFNHILSRIDFQVNADPSVKVYVQSIKVYNVCKTAPYEFANGWGTKTAVDNEAFIYMPVVAGVAQKIDGVKALVGTAANAMMMMPQAITDAPTWANPTTWDASTALTTGSYIEVVYRMTAQDGSDLVGYADATQHPNYVVGTSTATELFVKVAYPIPANWAMTTKYTYTINLGTANATGGINTEDNFVDEKGDDSDLPVIVPGVDPVDPINPGDPIIDTNKVIDLTVSVGTWTTGTTSDID